jgi:hypothetical protein
MARKKSGRRAAQTFTTQADDVLAFAAAVCASGLSKEHVSWAHDLAIIRLYRDFENLMLTALVVAINNDTKTISSRTGLAFPKHLSDEVCEYLIVGTRYFDFKGREGLIREIQKFVPPAHYLVPILKKQIYRVPLDRMCALRNFAAHGSSVARKSAMSAVGVRRMSSAGAWLKGKGRLAAIVDPLKALAAEIEAAAPF